MKKHLILIAISILITISVIGQNQRHRQHQERHRMKADKIAFITERLDLGVEEAQKFWPIYNEFSNKSHELFQEEREILRNLRHNSEQYSQDQMSEMLNRVMDIKIERAELEKKYHKKYKEVLSIEKILLLYEAEFGFRRQLLRRYKDN